MKIHHVAGVLLVIASLVAGTADAKDEYSFKVHNTSGSAIKKLLVSEDGKEWGFFEIGDGIEAGASVTLVWDESTNKEDCKQHFKAVFADGEESEPVIFDFCEEDLELEF